MADEYRLAAGHITKAAIEASSSYLISNFPVQADQPDAIVWEVADPGKLRRYQERVVSLAGRSGAMGKRNSVLTISIMTSGMVEYIDSEIFDGEETVEATVKLRNRRIDHTDDYEVYHCLITNCDPDEMELFNGYAYTDVPYKLTRMTLVTE